MTVVRSNRAAGGFANRARSNLRAVSFPLSNPSGAGWVLVTLIVSPRLRAGFAVGLHPTR